MSDPLGRILGNLKRQVEAGLSNQPGNSASLQQVEKPVRIGELIAKADVAREELRHSNKI